MFLAEILLTQWHIFLIVSTTKYSLKYRNLNCEKWLETRKMSINVPLFNIICTSFEF